MVGFLWITPIQMKSYLNYVSLLCEKRKRVFSGLVGISQDLFLIILLFIYQNTFYDAQTAQFEKIMAMTQQQQKQQKLAKAEHIFTNLLDGQLATKIPTSTIQNSLRLPNKELAQILKQQMQKMEDLKQQYMKDLDTMSSKSRFGYFSILPFTSAGANAYQQKKTIKNYNGQVKTEQRNIFSGVTASGILKKCYFHYETSVYQGDPYIDPGKHQREQKARQYKKLNQKETFKPADLIKIAEAKSVYEHLPERYDKKMKKDYIDGDGKIKTQNRNIMANSLINIQNQREKSFKYVPSPYNQQLIVQREKLKNNIKLRGQMPFKSASPSKPLFYTNRQTYSVDNSCLQKLKNKNNSNWQVIAQHQSKFKPSSCKKYDIFSYPQYIPPPNKIVQTTRPSHLKQNFRGSTLMEKSKPCPSISLLKTNILRVIR